MAIPPVINPLGGPQPLPLHGEHGTGGSGPAPIVLLGGGGHALVVAEAALLAEMRIAGFLDDNPAAPLAAILIDLPRPFPAPAYLGPLESVELLEGRHWIVAMGDLGHRRRMLRIISARSAPPSRHTPPALSAMARSVVHPTAFVSPSALIGPGVYVGPRAVVHARARIGSHAIVNSGAIVEHDCTVGENSHIAPGAALGGAAHVGHDSLVGLGARVLPGLVIGHGCMVGAGSVVIRPVADGVAVAGVPARTLRSSH